MVLKRLVLVRHSAEPDDDLIVTEARAAGFDPVICRPCLGEALGQPDERLAGTVIYGGPFDAYAWDRHAFLRDEARWIEACMAAGVPVLGLCQGAQQIAHIHGAPVGPRPDGAREFGVYRIEPTAAGRAEGFLAAPLWVPQNHYHGYGLPAGAVCLAGTGLYPNQAMRIGARVLALQFHAEVSPAGFRRWQDGATEAWAAPGAQHRAEQDRLFAAHRAGWTAWLQAQLDRLFGLRQPHRMA